MIKIIQLSKHRAELPSVKTKEQPCSTWGTLRETLFSHRSPLRGISMQASLPKYPKVRKTWPSRTWRKTSRGATSLCYALGNADRLGFLRNATRKWCTDQMTCVDTSLANTFLLAHVPKPLHSWFLFPGRAWGVFFLFPPPSFLARGQPSPQNRLQDRYCRVPRNVTWLEERMKSETKPHSFLFLTPC